MPMTTKERDGCGTVRKVEKLDLSFNELVKRFGIVVTVNLLWVVHGPDLPGGPVPNFQSYDIDTLKEIFRGACCFELRAAIAYQVEDVIVFHDSPSDYPDPGESVLDVKKITSGEGKIYDADILAASYKYNLPDDLKVKIIRQIAWAIGDCGVN